MGLGVEEEEEEDTTITTYRIPVSFVFPLSIFFFLLTFTWLSVS